MGIQQHQQHDATFTSTVSILAPLIHIVERCHQDRHEQLNFIKLHHLSDITRLIQPQLANRQTLQSKTSSAFVI